MRENIMATYKGLLASKQSFEPQENRGGKRKGSGRKKKPPTKVIRVPVSKLPEIEKILKRVD